LAGVRPRDLAGKTRKRVAAELVRDLQRIYQRSKDADKELGALLAATGTSLLRLHGIGPTGAARLLVEVGDVTRFQDRNHFASWNGSAPIEPPPAMSCATGCPGQATVRSTGCAEWSTRHERAVCVFCGN
jgi:transposase